jgi:pSer/pThr/pTyr-binding forkhead associated (FHA) protein
MGSAMLFVPPHSPVALPARGEVVIGRGRENALRLPDPDTSRRHARILCEAGRYRVQDLASTNGTFVNGERIQEHDLAPGDRIRIGANRITFCELGNIDLKGGDDGAQTMLIAQDAPARTSDAFQGDLGEIPPFAVIQMLEMGRKSGCLEIDSDRESGRLWFDGGHPVHAETKSQLGFDAAVSLVHADAGHFRFESKAQLPEATIRATVTELLLEASRQLDEARDLP